MTMLIAGAVFLVALGAIAFFDLARQLLRFLRGRAVRGPRRGEGEGP